MNSKDEMLQRLRRQAAPDSPLPARFAQGIRFENREQQFLQTLQGVGGRAILGGPHDSLSSLLDQVEWLRGEGKEERRIACAVPGLEIGNFDMQAVSDPHELDGVDVAIVRGAFAVAENAAVWVSGADMPHRALLFLTEHLVLVVPRRELIDHLHQAYERLRFDEAGYGVFISGPSKTADIEQSLVIGAHGPRSLTVILCE